MSETKKRGLGRGLSALLGEEDDEVGAAVSGGNSVSGEAAHPGPGGTTQLVAISDLAPSPFQPRSNFDDEAIDDLAASIRQKGIIQPILVRASSTGETVFEIIAGERRWRAAQRAQLHEVPVLVREFDDRETAEIALIENLQRQDLSALEEAEGYNRLMAEFSHTQEALGQALGKSRSHIANSLRLLSLPSPIKQMLTDKVLSAGHARALLGADNAVELATQIVKKGLNVRQTEKLVKTDGGKLSRPKKEKGSASAEKDPDTVSLERDLSNMLGLAVSIDFDGAGGRLTVRYDTLEQLDDILQRLTHGRAESVAADGDGGSAVDLAEDDNEFDSMFMDDGDEGELAEADDGAEDITKELESIADTSGIMLDLTQDDEGEDDQAPEADEPVARDEIDEAVFADVFADDDKKPS
ncbi:ParB/RepB/Spo0J family partition protein [Thalassospira marina]|uniref:Chromosome partitioning protein ParB n=1 Tax=Thalassospira marina TaxID=2048283 RepID=A0ABN5FJY7_9PROT|nr:ParB/RepB/Spo0J family partition protein [Thalassospira marina]AUG54653.1 chromosome partitioning protein ParB [Thalassospira marina]